MAVKFKEHPIGYLSEGFQKYGPPPWLTALAVAGLTYGGLRQGWGSAVETIRSIGRPFGVKHLGGEKDPKANARWNMAMDKLKNRSDLRWKLPAILSGGTLLAALYAFHRPDRKNYRLTDWNAPLAKKSSLDPSGYIPSFDYSSTIGLNTANSLFNNDPNLADYPYSRHMGTAIVNDAALREHTSRPTLGGILDSAVNKIENKLSFSGLANVGLKTMVANSAARLFTGALSTVCDLSPSAREKIVDAGTWAGAITSIFE